MKIVWLVPLLAFAAGCKTPNGGAGADGSEVKASYEYAAPVNYGGKQAYQVDAQRPVGSSDGSVWLAKPAIISKCIQAKLLNCPAGVQITRFFSAGKNGGTLVQNTGYIDASQGLFCAPGPQTDYYSMYFTVRNDTGAAINCKIVYWGENSTSGGGIPDGAQGIPSPSDGGGFIPDGAQGIPSPSNGGGFIPDGAQGIPSPPKLGASLVTRNVAGRSWLYVASIVPGGRAGQAGLRAGDYILRVNGRDTNQVQDYDFAVAQSGQAGSLVLEIWRNQQNATITVPWY